MSARSPLAALAWAALTCAAVLSLSACSSSDDVVASLDEPSSTALPSASAGVAPLLTIVQSVSDTAPAPGFPASAGTALPPPPIAGSTSAGIERPAPPGAPLGEALFVSGTPQSPPLAGAERWPLQRPLRQFFPPAPEHQSVVLVVQGVAREALRELAVGYGLGVAAPLVGVLVEDAVGDQFQLVLSDDPPLAGPPLPAGE